MLLLNQAFMMLWEAILENASLVIVLVLMLLITWVYWAVMGNSKRAASRPAAISAIVVAVIGFFGLPIFFKASLSDMSYWVDWAFHLATVLALLIYAYLVMLPLLTGLVGSTKSKA